MKKFFALCSMIVALGFVAGCPSDAPAPAPVPPAGDTATEAGGDAETPAEDGGAAGE